GISADYFSYSAAHSRQGPVAAPAGWAVVSGGASGAGGEKALTTGGTGVHRGSAPLVGTFRGVESYVCYAFLCPARARGGSAGGLHFRTGRGFNFSFNSHSHSYSHSYFHASRAGSAARRSDAHRSDARR